MGHEGQEVAVASERAVGSNAPLEGVTVLELGTVIMVPYAAQLLADLGARVIRIEGDRRDSGRVIGGALAPGISGAALNLQRNKESIQIDLKSDDGIEVARRMLADADVLITNMRRGALDRLHLGFAEVQALNERLVYCNANGFAADGPDADRPAFDDIIQAETGLAALAEHIAERPRFMPMLVADKLAALYAVQGVLAALLRRERTGRGGLVEVPMFDAVLSFNLVEHLAGATVAGGRTGYTRILSDHRGPHRTRDGYVAVMPYSDEDWRGLYEAVGRADELDDPVFQDHRLRLENPDIVYASLARVISQRTTDEWVELCGELGVPVAPVRELDDVVTDDQLHRGAISERTHPLVGTYRHIEHPIRFDGVRPGLRAPAPLVGEHSERILGELGFTPQQVAAMLGSGAVTAADVARIAAALEETGASHG